MAFGHVFKAIFALSVLFGLAGCGGGNGGGLFGGGGGTGSVVTGNDDEGSPVREIRSENPEVLDYRSEGGTTLWDLFKPNDTGTNVKVNRYLWNASLEVLNFLPIQSVDPFSGVIVTGYGTPPGGGRAYRATIYVKDPALEARSLNVALQSSGGRPVSAGTQRAIEDAILARARQLRIADGKL